MPTSRRIPVRPRAESLDAPSGQREVLLRRSVGLGQASRLRVESPDDQSLVRRPSSPRRPRGESPGGQRADLVIGIDASLTGFGLVVFNFFTGEVVANHLLKTKPGAMTRRYKEIEAFVIKALREAGPQRIAHVCLEDFNRGARNAREESGMLRLTVLFALHEVFGDQMLAYPTLVAISTLKKFVTGSGKGDKNVMLLHTYKKWGIEYHDDNLADAHGLARIAGALVSGREPEHKYERECLAAVGRSHSWEPAQPH